MKKRDETYYVFAQHCVQAGESLGTIEDVENSQNDNGYVVDGEVGDDLVEWTILGALKMLGESHVAHLSDDDVSGSIYSLRCARNVLVDAINDGALHWRLFDN